MAGRRGSLGLEKEVMGLGGGDVRECRLLLSPGSFREYSVYGVYDMLAI